MILNNIEMKEIPHNFTIIIYKNTSKGVFNKCITPGGVS